MKRVLLLALPAVLFAGQPRYARLGEFDGTVEVQLHPADPWSPAERNLTLRELAWLRTAASSRLEIELDEGSGWRLGPDSQMEISDYSLLSSGQRLTVLSLDRGLAYFTGEPLGRDTLMLVLPGAQVTLIRGARVRLEATAGESRISVIEGVVRLSCPAAEIDLTEGQTVYVEPANAERFSLDREVSALDLDQWSEARDKVLAAPPSQNRVAQHFGVADLDASGEWMQTDIGAVWKPRVAEGWLPFQSGHWRWYDGLGYTWVSADTWGWLPYHFGRWIRRGDMGWVWSPGPTTGVFKPGDVFWLYGLQLAGWGPLAPGERWAGNSRPQQYTAANTTWAAFPQDAAVIDPAGHTNRPADPLAVAVFRVALPSPAFVSARLEAMRPPLRVGATRFTPVLPGTTFQDTNEIPPAATAPPVDTAPPAAGAPPAYPPDPGAPVPPVPVPYPVPVYTGVVVVNPPDHPDYSHPNPNRGNPTNPKPTTIPPASQPPDASGESKPRIVHPPSETRPNEGPRPAPVEHTKLGPPRQVVKESGNPSTPPPAKTEESRPNPTPPPARTEAPRPAPSAPAPPPAQHVEAPRPAPAPPAPRVEAPKVESKTDSKTDTSTKKQ